MKPPITVEPRTNNAGVHTLKFVGADGEEAELVFTLPNGSSVYQGLHELKESLGELVSDFLRKNGIADVVPPPPPPKEEPAPAAPAEPPPPPPKDGTPPAA